MTRKILVYVTFLTCLCFTLPCYALDDSQMPEQATLSANRMRFDAETGDFLADGNVVITAGELRVTAPQGSGNVDRREVSFNEGINASGKWYGDNIDIMAGRLLLSFLDIPTCSFRDVVRGSIGTMRLDADRLTITGVGGVSDPSGNDRKTKFWLTKVRSLEDTSRGLSFGADSVEGLIISGDLYELTAKKGVWLKGKPKAKGDAVSLKGDNALYSIERGSVVVSGHVVAVQGGRTLRSDSVVYFPDQNRVEALGGLTRRTEDGAISADRAEITIDLTRERRDRQDTPAISPAPQPEQGTQDKPQTLKIDTRPKAKPQTGKARKNERH
ncbi:MAG: hypothetical protein IJG65_01085 [Synergistaceae bacterium]|nr:hypothetical protein [Synergistaceae bacterium]